MIKHTSLNSKYLYIYVYIIFIVDVLYNDNLTKNHVTLIHSLQFYKLCQSNIE